MSVFTPQTVRLADGTTLQLRSPEEADAQRLIDRLDRVRRESTGIMIAPEDELPTLEWERDWIRGVREGAGVQILAVSPDGELIALCGLHAGKMHHVRHGASLGISIDAPWCGRGLGTVLMRELIDWAQASDTLDVITLCVFTDNPRAICLYEKSGFVREGVSRWAVKIDGRYIDDIRMSRWVGQGSAPADAMHVDATFMLAVEDGLTLRLDQAEHADELFAVIDANRANLDPWLPWVQATRHVDDTRGFGSESRRKFTAGTDLPLTIVEHGRVLGKIGLHHMNSPSGSAELGYWLAQEAQGRGVMTKAARRVIDYAFLERGVRRVFLWADALNDSSCRVAQRLGMRREAELKQDFKTHQGDYRDSVLYAVLATEWRDLIRD